MTTSTVTLHLLVGDPSRHRSCSVATTPPSATSSPPAPRGVTVVPRTVITPITDARRSGGGRGGVGTRPGGPADGRRRRGARERIAAGQLVAGDVALLATYGAARGRHDRRRALRRRRCRRPAPAATSRWSSSTPPAGAAASAARSSAPSSAATTVRAGPGCACGRARTTPAAGSTSPAASPTPASAPPCTRARSSAGWSGEPRLRPVEPRRRQHRGRPLGVGARRRRGG